MSRFDFLLLILQLALAEVGKFARGGQADISLIEGFIRIIQAAKRGIEAESGKPFDLSKIPFEDEILPGN